MYGPIAQTARRTTATAQYARINSSCSAFGTFAPLRSSAETSGSPNTPSSERKPKLSPSEQREKRFESQNQGKAASKTIEGTVEAKSQANETELTDVDAAEDTTKSRTPVKSLQPGVLSSYEGNSDHRIVYNTFGTGRKRLRRLFDPSEPHYDPTTPLPFLQRQLSVKPDTIAPFNPIPSDKHPKMTPSLRAWHVLTRNPSLNNKQRDDCVAKIRDLAGERNNSTKA